MLPARFPAEMASTILVRVIFQDTPVVRLRRSGSIMAPAMKSFKTGFALPSRTPANLIANARHEARRRPFATWIVLDPFSFRNGNDELFENGEVFEKSPSGIACSLKRDPTSFGSQKSISVITCFPCRDSFYLSILQPFDCHEYFILR